MIVFAGLITGLLSAILLIALWLSLFAAAMATVSSTLLLIVFFILWGGSTYIISVGATSPSIVWARGALVGAIEWLLVGLVMLGMMFGGLMKATEGDASPAGFGGAILASGFMTTIGLAFVLFMVLCSLTVWFVAKKSQTEFAAASDIDKPIRRACPHCAEEILPAATTCPFCKLAVEEQQVCPSCHQLGPAHARYCMQCGKLKLLQS